MTVILYYGSGKSSVIHENNNSPFYFSNFTKPSITVAAPVEAHRQYYCLIRFSSKHEDCKTGVFKGPVYNVYGKLCLVHASS